MFPAPGGAWRLNTASIASVVDLLDCGADGKYDDNDQLPVLLAAVLGVRCDDHGDEPDVEPLCGVEDGDVERPSALDEPGMSEDRHGEFSPSPSREARVVVGGPSDPPALAVAVSVAAAAAALLPVWATPVYFLARNDERLSVSELPPRRSAGGKSRSVEALDSAPGPRVASCLSRASKPSRDFGLVSSLAVLLLPPDFSSK
eukprot:COSAG05_NODE_5965_length_1050_cov_0.951630_1_plen_202_part_00